MRSGALTAFSAYVLWGLLPVYWKLLDDIPAFETLCHRAIWSLVFVIIVLGARRQWSWIRDVLKNRRTLMMFMVSGSLLGLNWFTYIWAVNSEFIVEASLGYFINPLVNVVLGVFILKESLRPLQWLAVGLAAAGVLYLTVGYGQFPWIALTLAMTFGIYGLLRKTAALMALEGLAVETSVMFFPAVSYLIYLFWLGEAAFFQEGTKTGTLLVSTGVISAIPLILFAHGAKKVRMITLGILQYVAPTLQFLLGVLVYGEDFSHTRVVGFVIIWSSLALYTTESIMWYKLRGPQSIKFRDQGRR
jgi:chloramphenicol-sensitive protein RarD